MTLPKYVWTPDTVRSLAISAPRYTSYPTADRFQTLFTSIDYLQAVYPSLVITHPQPLAIYVHIPFCDHACFYCACNKISTKNRQLAEDYLQRLEQEIEKQASLFRHSHEVVQLHLGGGTPTFLTDSQLKKIVDKIRASFSIKPRQAKDWSIEMDPRTITAERFKTLHELGFSRVSFGIQDIHPNIQQAIGRIQPNLLISDTLIAARKVHFSEIGFDLIYGLPHQTLESYELTLDQVIDWKPDYATFFNYAHLPTRFTAQRRIKEADLPPPGDRLKILEKIIDRMTNAGYIHIGLDHFALPHTALAKAAQSGRLYRNFQGYTAYANIDLLGIGASAISQIGPSFAQNYAQLADYQNAIDQGLFATARGIRLSRDDQIRQKIIQSIMCQYRLDFSGIETHFSIEFEAYFEKELEALKRLQALHIIEYHGKGLKVTPTGRLFLRHVALVFDRYLADKTPTPAQYSSTI